jgi:putative tricarboxylic transport membrane protein
VIAMLVAPGLENGLRQSLSMSGGSASIFFTRPLAATLLALIVAGVGLMVWRQWRLSSTLDPGVPKP